MLSIYWTHSRLPGCGSRESLSKRKIAVMSSDKKKTGKKHESVNFSLLENGLDSCFPPSSIFPTIRDSAS